MNPRKQSQKHDEGCMVGEKEEKKNIANTRKPTQSTHTLRYNSIIQIYPMLAIYSN